MTAEEFEQAYARRSGVLVEWLRRYRTVRPCDCGADDCEGWQSLSHEAAKEYDAWQALYSVIGSPEGKHQP